MNWYSDLARPLLFQCDAETAHELGMAAIQSGVVSGGSLEDTRLHVHRFGASFRNPIGLAAGFDKNATALESWERFGFGFVEVGTVTAISQSGNDRPRLFRIPEDRALINRMGFNNEGAERMASRLQLADPHIPYGVNFGKSKIAPLDRAVEDYVKSFTSLRSFGSYAVVNVSSPNTPGLRKLQDKGPLGDILSALKAVDPQKPLFLKVSPDLTLDALDDCLESAIEHRLEGIIATNTTIDRSVLHHASTEQGGISGKPLKSRADEALSHLARQAPPTLTLIGVGGVMTADDVWDKIALGAHLVQIYTGWVYGGPQTVPRLLRGLLELMDQRGVETVEQLRGVALKRG